ncbi:hypothetical protein [Neoaquamicrobium sediminum]|uniref:hypothetical protein n=1 Tax=Neoaquamicrobium sediminum TaxID=1849104 RepID=UPI001565E13B|nr:hypothetical protein [Mesorhizobium sediminum]NRC54153.1 hypothetical protein [Mesorhizobium sediminum]
MDLEEKLRTAIKHGGLLSIALYKSSANPKMWIATYLNDSGRKHDSVEDEDPIVAIEKAMRPLRQKPPKDNPPPVARQVKSKRRSVDDLV